MSDREMHFPAMSNYPKNSDTAIAVDAVEAWLDQFPQKRAENKPNGGIIQSLADTSAMSLRELSGKERKAARAKAQREHRQALKNLAKQEAADAKEIAKQLAEWRKEDRRKDSQSKQVSDGMTQAGQEVLDKLLNQGFFDVADWNMSYKYLQRTLRAIRDKGYKVRGERENRIIVRYVLDKQ